MFHRAKLYRKATLRSLTISLSLSIPFLLHPADPLDRYICFMNVFSVPLCKYTQIQICILISTTSYTKGSICTA